jgi:hypothetical protein
LAGGSATTTIAGATFVGTVGNPGILAPGVGNSAANNQQMVFTNPSGITVANGSQVQMSISTPTLNSSSGAVSAWLSSGQSLNDYFVSNPGVVASFNVAPAAYGDHDYIQITSSGLSLGTRASGSFGDGALLIQDNNYLTGTPAQGDVFNLLDWSTAMTGAFAVPGNTTAGGTFGDLDLPTLGGTLVWDVSALQTQGIIAVASTVPEPSRVVLLWLSLSVVLMRRRRTRA